MFTRSDTHSARLDGKGATLAAVEAACRQARQHQAPDDASIVVAHGSISLTWDLPAGEPPDDPVHRAAIAYEHGVRHAGGFQAGAELAPGTEPSSV